MKRERTYCERPLSYRFSAKVFGFLRRSLWFPVPSKCLNFQERVGESAKISGFLQRYAFWARCSLTLVWSVLLSARTLTQKRLSAHLGFDRCPDFSFLVLFSASLSFFERALALPPISSASLFFCSISSGVSFVFPCSRCARCCLLAWNLPLVGLENKSPHVEKWVHMYMGKMGSICNFPVRCLLAYGETALKS